MKKPIVILVSVLLLGSVVWGVHRWLSESMPEVEEEAKEVSAAGNSTPGPDQTVSLPAGNTSATAPQENMPSDEVDAQNPDQEKALPPAEKERYQTYFQESEKAWESRMEEFFLKESGLGEEKYKTYLRMREGFERDKMEAFEAHHQFMKAQYGENYTYRPSSDEQTFSREVSKKYEESLQKLIGDDAFAKFRDIRTDFNAQLKKDADQEIGHMVMEF